MGLIPQITNNLYTDWIYCENEIGYWLKEAQGNFWTYIVKNSVKSWQSVRDDETGGKRSW
jgi:hypothetical protein